MLKSRPCPRLRHAPGVDEVRCVLNPGMRHRIHVSRFGLYRWNDKGVLQVDADTPLFTQAEFAKLYDVLDQVLDTAPVPAAEWPQTPLGAAVAAAGPHKRPLQPLRDRWREYDVRKPVERFVSRLAYTCGAIIAVAISALLVVGVLIALVGFVIAVGGAVAAWITS